MKQLRHLNICYNSKVINNEISDYLTSNWNNLLNYSKEEELLDLLEKKKVNILITDYNFELLKKVRNKNHDIQILAVLEELKKDYLLQSLELEYIKFLKDSNTQNEFTSTLVECQKNLDSRKSNIITLKNDYVFDKYNKSLFKNGEIVSLSNKETALLDLFINNENKVLTYEEIDKSIWNENMSQDVLRTVIKQLRRKTYKELIKNISGIGYRLDLI